MKKTYLLLLLSLCYMQLGAQVLKLDGPWKCTLLDDADGHPLPPSQLREVVVNLPGDRKSTRLNSSHANISYAVFCLKKKKKNMILLRSLVALIRSPARPTSNHEIRISHV